MNELKSAVRPAAHYDTDYFAWTAEQARQLRIEKPRGLGWENVAEEIESLGRSDKRALGSALKIVLERLLKWRVQPEKRSASWSDSIDEHRDRILRILEDSPSLVSLPEEILQREYHRARRKALRDSGLAAERIPAASPFTADEAIDPDFLPDKPVGGLGQVDKGGWRVQ